VDPPAGEPGSPAEKPSSDAFTDGLDASNQFAARSLAVVAKRETGNVFLSPPSLRLALGMTFVGAEGTTAKEMAGALGLDADRAKVTAQAKREIGAWKAANGKDVELAVANRLWGDKGQPFEKAFLDMTREGWGAPLEPVDFKNAFEPARKTINGWVKQETKDKIPEILPAGSLTPLTRLVLTNAVYFKGKWATPFDKKNTRPAPFHVNGAEKPVPLPTMHASGHYKYAEEGGIKLVEMPYGRGDLAMVIALPSARNGLDKVLSELSSEKLAAWHKKLAPAQKIELSLPSFEFSFGGSVKEDLKSFGMKRAFAADAEFEQIAKGAKLSVSDVFHKTYVKVDESGTEAAAATAVVVATRGLSLSTAFVVDHPFLFYLHDTKTGRVLFIGKVVNPAAK